MEQLGRSLVQRTRAVAIALGVIAAVLLPVGYFTIVWNQISGSLTAEVVVTARIISRHINAQPDSWQFQTHRLEALLDPTLARELGEQRRILDPGHRVLVDVSFGPPSWRIARSAPLFDSGIEVGRLEIARPIGAMLGRTAVVAVLASALAAAFVLAIERLPLRALVRSERRFKAVVDSASDAILLLRRDGRILSANASGSVMFGIPVERLRGMRFGDLIDSGSRDRLAEAWNAAPESGPRGRPVELDAVSAGGDVLPVELSLSVWGAGDGQYRTAILRDVTDRKRAEEALRSTEEQFRQAQRLEAVGRLAAGVAHDFNNLISVILGRAEIALSQLGPEHPVRRQIETVRGSAQRAAGLTRQLLAFARKQVLQPKVLDLNEVVTGLSSMLRRLIGEDITFAVVPGGGLGLVKADPGQIEQVLMNLVVNARDAMPNGGKVTIATANAELDEAYAEAHPDVSPGPYVLVSVADTGEGMDAATRARIFEPFFTTKEAGKGTGLGLATVYGIVRQSGGHIWVYSEPGLGTTFKIYLPRCAGVPEPPPAPSVIPRGHSEVVLLVEDEENVRTVARDILQRLGYQVLEAAGPGAAIEIARTAERIDLLLTDVVMPVMNGRDLAEWMAEERRDVAVMYMSGYTGAALMEQHGVPGTAGFLEKPFTTESLAVKVRDALATRGDTGADRNATAQPIAPV